MSQIKILHVITGLENGGAEKILFDFVTHSNREKYQHIVVSLQDLGHYGPLLIKKNLKVHTLSMRKMAPFQLWKLWRILTVEKPDVIQSWLYHANFLTIFIFALGYTNIIWGIHNTLLPWKTSSKLTIFLNKTCSLFSFIPKKIIFCGIKAKEVHLSIGYKKKSSIVIHNGYDLTHFYPHRGKNDALLEQLSLKNAGIIIGNVGRFDPAKDHKNLLEALGLVKPHSTHFTLLLAGKEMDQENHKVKKWIKENKLEENVRLLGKRSDISELYQIMAFLILSSEAEAFPNVLAEAMACGIPCISTEVGDATTIIGDTGLIVPIKNPSKLAQATIKMLMMPATKREQLGNLARNRVESHFSLSKMTAAYENLYQEFAR